jgi:DNA polymerase-3 subunit alpha
MKDTKALDSLVKRLQPQPSNVAGGGDVSLILRLDLQTEVEFKLDGRFQVSPQIAGAIKAVSGVEMVETL